MNWEIYTAIIDTSILVLLAVWSYLDRTNKYFKAKS